MSRRSVLRRLFAQVVAVLAAVQVGTPLLAQPAAAPPRFPGAAPPGAAVMPASAAAEPLRFTRNESGDAAPIVLAADDISTWYESEQTVVVLLRGQTLVQQGTFQLRCQQAVARFDIKGQRLRGIWLMDLYAEGKVRLDTSTETKEGERAVVDLATRGEIKVHAVKSKAAQKAQADDPLYRTALAERARVLNQPVTQPAEIQRVGLPAAPAPVVPAPRPSAPTPLSPPPAPLVPPLLGSPAPAVPPPPFIPPSAPGQVSPPGPPKPLSAAPAPGNVVVRAAPPDPPPPVAGTPVPFPPSGPLPCGPAAVTPPVPLPPPTRPAAGPEVLPTPRTALGQTFSVRPRFGSDFQLSNHPLGNGENAYVITGGVIVNVRNAPGIGQVDLEADQCVIFTRGKAPDAGAFRQPQAVGEGTKVEFFLKGNVEIREMDPKRGERVLRADEIFYDVDRNVAIALSAQFEMRQPNLPDPIVFKADELRRTSKDTYEVLNGDVSSSKLPSDPGLKVYFTTATIEDKSLPKISIFGRQVIDRATGGPLTEHQTYIRARNVFFELEGIPFFYLPYLAGDARDPLGPVEAVSAGFSHLYGGQFGVTLNLYDLLGIQPLAGTRWRLMLDELTYRGPAAGTEFDYSGKDFLGLPSQHYDGYVKAYGIYDNNFDNLGGNRPVQFQPPAFRGRAEWRQTVNDLPYGFTVQSQVAAVSDRNFLEMYYKPEWDADVNKNSYVYVKEQGDFWAWTGLAGGRLGREWVTETEWLPRLDGYLFGLSPAAPFDMLTYSAHASAAYAQLRRSNDPASLPLSPTDQNSQSARGDLMQELAVPLVLGPVRVVPYAKLDLSAYSEDLNGDARGRVWGGAGVRASIPFTRLFPDVQSDLFNVNGINHKVVLSANYFYGDSTDPHTRFAQFDRLNDEAGDQAVRDVRPIYYNFMSSAKAGFLNYSPLFDPQVYANRRLLDTNPDSLDAIQVLQLDLNQRWQTKRGYPGAQHIEDWMTLDVSASIFPQANRDNFGNTVGLLEYDWAWNIGDRTALVSSGLVDPFENGAKVFTAGAFLNRPDRTSFYLGFRSIEPLESRLVVGSVTYVFSPKYAMTLSSSYDFGPSQAQSTSLVMTRIGTDLTVSLGVSYNSLQSNFGLVFNIVPNLAANSRTGGGLTSSTLAGSGLR